MKRVAIADPTFARTATWKPWRQETCAPEPLLRGELGCFSDVCRLDRQRLQIGHRKLMIKINFSRSIGALAAICSVFCFLAASSAALAEQSSSKICSKETSTPGTQICMERAYKAADKKLNEAYKAALAYIDKDDDSSPDDKANWKSELKNSQKAWIAFRDADCGDLIVLEWHKSTGMSAAINACQYDKTVQRTVDLTSRY